MNESSLADDSSAVADVASQGVDGGQGREGGRTPQLMLITKAVTEEEEGA